MPTPRSIPAYAGEPHVLLSPTTTAVVYPRVCGGTYSVVTLLAFSVGLSPRMRGNQPRRQYGSYKVGSIPAYAGEPLAVRLDYGDVQVYPRVCGGTASWHAPPSNRRGLSPRMRGNLRRHTGEAQPPRSIPAYAGEPAGRAGPCRNGQVYPRVCGGTRMLAIIAFRQHGLSPRMRGNRRRRAGCGVPGGSIPAYAGEP